MDGMSLNLHGYHWDKLKSSLDCGDIELKDNLKSVPVFGDLDPIFKITSQLTKVDFIAKMRCFLSKWTDIHQT